MDHLWQRKELKRREEAVRVAEQRKEKARRDFEEAVKQLKPMDCTPQELREIYES